MSEKKALFAGGCFWCMESPFTEISGVIEVVPGYTGGSTENPSYEEVCTGRTGHLEAVEVTYDPDIVSYGKLLDVFWKQIDPTDENGQFADRGTQYSTAVFFLDSEQEREARKSLKKLEDSGIFEKPVATRILPAAPFYRAEEYHHKFHLKNPDRYRHYRKGSGREAFIKKYWNDGS